MNGAPGRRVRAISAHARLIAPGVRISMNTFMLTAPSGDASGSGIVQSIGKKVSGGEDQIRYRRSTMLAPVREQCQELHCPVLDGRGQVFNRH